MPAHACRDALMSAPRDNGAHAGLLLARYLRVPVPAKEQKSHDDQEGVSHPDDRRQLHQAAINATTKAAAIYQLAYERYLADLQTIPSLVDKQLNAQGRLIVGLGGENVLETDITLHHTYGIPVIPGSALKGLASHYCDQVWGAQDPEFKSGGVDDQNDQGKLMLRSGKHYHTLFGANDDAGYIIFHDAWIEPASLKTKSGLVRDVMTPHHGDYYADPKHPPADSDAPNPVTFLSVTGTFYFAVSCHAEGEAGKQWAEFAMNLLVAALRHWGVGGKTNAGYGRMAEANYEPKFNPGDHVSVRRVEDPKGKGRLWFQADDNFGGRVIRGAEPQVDIGSSVTLWIVSVNRNYLTGGYNFSSEPPSTAEPSRQKTRKKR